MISEENILWIDLEMTGLNHKSDKILEIACIVTDKDLNTIALGPDLAIKHSKSNLKSMSEWSRTHHKASGLLERIDKEGISLEKAESNILDFVKQYCVEGKTVIAGNSIHADRRFIKEHMTKLDKYLHFRMIDVTSIRELARRWYKDLDGYPSKDTHRAVEDIQVSIDMLKFLKESIFK